MENVQFKRDFSCFTSSSSLVFFQAMVQVINAVLACVQRVRSFEQIPDLDAIRSLPTCVLKVLRKTFLHCKVSIYLVQL